MSLFSAVYVQHSYTDLALHQEYKSHTESDKIQAFSSPKSDFQKLFKADLFFKNFSRMPPLFKYFSSLCKPWFRKNNLIAELWKTTIYTDGQKKRYSKRFFMYCMWLTNTSCTF